MGGDVEVAADAGRGGHDVEDVVSEVGGEGGDEAEARERGDFIVEGLEEFGEGGAFFCRAVGCGDVEGFGFVDVVVDGLAEESDFEATGIDKFLGFLQDGIGRAQTSGPRV